MFRKMLKSVRAAALALVLAKALHVLVTLAHDVAGDIAAHYLIKVVAIADE